MIKCLHQYSLTYQLFSATKQYHSLFIQLPVAERKDNHYRYVSIFFSGDDSCVISMKTDYFAFIGIQVEFANMTGTDNIIIIIIIYYKIILLFTTNVKLEEKKKNLK